MQPSDRPDLHLDRLHPTTPSPMMGHLGGKPGTPPLPWWKYLLAIWGVPFRTPSIWDDDPPRPST